MSANTGTVQDGHLTGYGTPVYRNYVLFLLMLVYTLNFIDRTLIAVVAQPIIDSFGLSDSQLALWPAVCDILRSYGAANRALGRSLKPR
jgi:hypothetical protein